MSQRFSDFKVNFKVMQGDQIASCFGWNFGDPIKNRSFHHKLKKKLKT